MDDQTPITERASAHSRDIDGAEDGAEVLRVMAACDRELYANHWGGYPGLANATVMSTIAELADVAAECIRVNDDRDGAGEPSAAKKARRSEDAEEGKTAKTCRSDGKAAVFITGAGTSGRLAYLAARVANATLRARGRTPCFHHIIAGGTPALFQCVESAEDDSAAAATDFDAALAAAGGDAITDALIVGVSCGLSATYVSTQLARAMDDPKGRFNVACLGFNPKKYARAAAGDTAAGDMAGVDGGGDGEGDTPAKGGNTNETRPRGVSFRDALWRMEVDEGGVLCASGQGRARGMRFRRRLAITPVVGPEAVTGSSRLKGGTATKLVLDAAFTAAIILAEGPLAAHESATRAGASARATDMVREALMAGSAATRAASAASAAGMGGGGVAAAVNLAAACLSSGGAIHYLGGGAAGVLGLIDAAEQVPTFGARRTDVQGWIDGGWHDLDLDLGSDPDMISPSKDTRGVVEISGAAFAATVAPTLRGGADVVVVLVTEENPSGAGAEAEAALARAVRERGVRVAVVCASGNIAPSPSPSSAAAAAMVSKESRMGKQLEAAAAAAAAAAGGGVAGTAAAALRRRLGGGDGGDGSGGDTVIAVNIIVDLTKGKGGSPSSPRSLLASLFAPRAVEVAVKHVLNGVSTGAHVLLGKTFGAKMIDVRVSNEKLFHRAARVVSEAAGVSLADATRALVRAIHGEDNDTAEAGAGRRAEGTEEDQSPLARLVQRPIAAHVAAASAAERVVPVAVLLAAGRGRTHNLWATVAEARAALRGDGIGGSVRGVLQRAGISSSSTKNVVK